MSYISNSATGQVSGAETDAKNLRNPAFVENREVVFEYGRQWFVNAQEEEEQRFEKDDFTIRDPKERRERRNNVLSLSLSHPNELVEKVHGTLVDVFGNLIDINRNIIPIAGGEGKDLLKNIYENSRHTIALHMELNARKGYSYREDSSGQKPSDPLKSGPDLFTSANNARDRSRWFIDVDKEGLTKINIPSSSETGNVPRLTRYETSSSIVLDDSGNPTNEEHNSRTRDDAKIFRNVQNRDVLIDQFGPGGIKVEGNEVVNRLSGKKSTWVEDSDSPRALPEAVEAGTAFHDITKTAQALLKENINNKASDIFEDANVSEGLAAINNSVNSRVPTASGEQPNAGGRSLHLNLDGSLESSIGANTVDRVSWILDTAGALVARLGRDKQGRSAVIHADGSVALELGGFDFIGEGSDDETDTRFVGRGLKREDSLPNDPKRFKSGQLVIRVRRANKSGDGPDNDDHLLIIDETGITVKTAGRMNLVSDMDMTFKSGSRILLEAPKVQIYENAPKYIRRDLRTG